MTNSIKINFVKFSTKTKNRPYMTTEEWFSKKEKAKRQREKRLKKLDKINGRYKR